MEPRILYPSRKRLLWFLAFGMAGILVSYALITEVPRSFAHLNLPFVHGVGWCMLIVYIFWIVGGLLNFSHRACFLKLDEEGLTAACLFLSFHVRWENIRDFRVIQPEYQVNGTTRVSSQRFVGLDIFDVSRISYNSRLYLGIFGYSRGPEAHAAYMRKKFDADAIMAVDYGLTTEALADLLNEWRLRKTGSATLRHNDNQETL